MENCFACGRPMRSGVPHLRRKVKTGEIVRRYRGRVSGVHQHFAVRVVCRKCAWRIDRDRFVKETLPQLLELGLALLVLLAALLSKLF